MSRHRRLTLTTLQLPEDLMVRQQLVQIVHVHLIHILHHLHPQSLHQLLLLHVGLYFHYTTVGRPDVHQISFEILQAELGAGEKLAILQRLLVFDDLDRVRQRVRVVIGLGLAVLDGILQAHLPQTQTL